MRVTSSREGPGDQMEPDSTTRLRVLWVVSTVLPEAAALFGLPQTPFGGWLVGSALALQGSQVDLTIVHASAGAVRETRLSTTARYEALPAQAFAEHLTDVIRDMQPSLVHVHGTEGEHTRTAVMCGAMAGVPTVVSIQGLLWHCAKHYTEGLPATVRYGFTPRDLVRRTNPELGRLDFERRGLQELDTIRLADHVIGRTAWDEACVTQIDAAVSYFHCDEVLRPSFYDAVWDQNGCQPHSIFVSQGGYPLKGLHRMLEALPLILREFPSAHLTVAGPDPTHSRSRLGAIRVGSYGRYLRRLIDSMSLGDAVAFVGVQDEQGMRSRLLDANVFVMPSSIENSPNSLAEATLMGLPAVSAFVGGVPSMVGLDGGVRLYSADAPYMLAHEVMSVFRDPQRAADDAARARRAAHARHAPARHAADLVSIYSEVAIGKPR
jgi:glycosyltransferase involved in cell wall biosynthesis